VRAAPKAARMRCKKNFATQGLVLTIRIYLCAVSMLKFRLHLPS